MARSTNTVAPRRPLRECHIVLFATEAETTRPMLRPAGPLDFAARLRLALGQGNLGRATVAREVGIDKSVVTRWLSG